jgi:hypothetical protein
MSLHPFRPSPLVLLELAWDGDRRSYSFLPSAEGDAFILRVHETYYTLVYDFYCGKQCAPLNT